MSISILADQQMPSFLNILIHTDILRPIEVFQGEISLLISWQIQVKSWLKVHQWTQLYFLFRDL